MSLIRYDKDPRDGTPVQEVKYPKTDSSIVLAVKRAGDATHQDYHPNGKPVVIAETPAGAQTMIDGASFDLEPGSLVAVGTVEDELFRPQVRLLVTPPKQAVVSK